MHVYVWVIIYIMHICPLQKYYIWKTLRVKFSTYLKWGQCVIWTITPSWVINVGNICFWMNYKEFQTPQTAHPHSHIQREHASFWGQKLDFLPFKIQECIYNYQIYDVNYIKTKKAQINIIKYIMKVVSSGVVSLVLPFNNNLLFWKKITLMTSLDFLLPIS